MIGRAQVAESMGFEVYEPGGGTQGPEKLRLARHGEKTWRQGTDGGGNAMRLRAFREFGIREFAMRELFASGIPDIPMCDELLLLWVSPPGYSMAHTTTSL
jgi:hypothetical protein